MMGNLETTDLHTEVKKCMIERLDLPQKPEEIANDAPLFNEGLGLDSIDALDLVVAFGKRFQVVIEEDHFAIFASVDAIVDFIRQRHAGRADSASE
jgi:acyl carrier protein